MMNTARRSSFTMTSDSLLREISKDYGDSSTTITGGQDNLEVLEVGSAYEGVHGLQ